MNDGDLKSVADYARRLWDAHGAKSVHEAASKAAEYEKQGDTQNAQLWRRIERALKEKRGPHVS